MKPHPFYTNAKCANPAYSLRYSWTGWLSDKSSPLDQNAKNFPGELLDRWESDGLRLLESDITSWHSRLLFSAKPNLNPVRIAKLVKGRLEHSLRQSTEGIKFSRKLSLRSLNNNTSSEVREYISKQILNERFPDPVYSAKLEEFTWIDRTLDYSVPSASRSGRYWYDLHMVFCVAKGDLLRTSHDMPLIRNALPRIAAKHDSRIGAYSIMPDQLHLALRGNIVSSPEEIAFSFLNNLAYLSKRPIWQPGYYVGTFGEYSMKVIRQMISF